MPEAALIRIVVKTSILLLAGFGAAVVLRKASASTRHLLWAITLTACALTPLLEIGVPRLEPPRLVTRYVGPTPAPAIHAMPAAARPTRAIPASIWMAGTAILLARIAISRAALARLLERTEDRGTFRISHETNIPFTARLVNPVIVLPSGSDRWTPEVVSAVLLHEKAHVDRRDNVTMLIGQIACAVHWFHPLTWIALRRLRAEQELACDDHVLAAGLRPSEYARHLTEIARAVGQRGFWRPAAVTMAASDLPERVRSILAVDRARGGVGRKHVFAAAVAIASVTLPLAAMRPPEDRGVIAGTVTDGAGAVPNAEVSILAISTNEIVTTRTDPVGRFRAEVAAGRYELYVRAPGFAVASLAGSVKANEQVRSDAVLRPGELLERIEVKAPRPSPGIGDPGPNSARHGGQVRPARLLVSVPPVYPPEARDAGVQGEVLLEGVIWMDGTVHGVREVLSPSPLLTRSAKECVSRWRYQPARLNGQPVETVTRIKVQFELEEK